MIRGRGARTLLPVLLFALLFVVETGGSERATAAEPAGALQPGFIEIVWEQPDQDVALAVSRLNAPEDRVSQVEAVFAWINADQSWRMYRPHGPDFLNTLETLQMGHMYWIFAIPVAEAVEVLEPEAEPAPVATPPGASTLFSATADLFGGPPSARLTLTNTSDAPIERIEIEYCMLNRLGGPVFQRGTGSQCIRGVYHPGVPIPPAGMRTIETTLVGYDTATGFTTRVMHIRWLDGSTWARP
jgi:hypothetical protein